MATKYGTRLGIGAIAVTVIGTASILYVDNVAPTVDAGTDPGDAEEDVAFQIDNATVSDDGRPVTGSFSCTWSESDGDGSCSFENSGVCTSTTACRNIDVTCDTASVTMTLTLTCSDGGKTGQDTVNVAIASGNDAPTVNAGTDPGFISESAPYHLTGVDIVDDGAVTCTITESDGDCSCTFDGVSDTSGECTDDATCEAVEIACENASNGTDATCTVTVTCDDGIASPVADGVDIAIEGCAAPFPGYPAYCPEDMEDEVDSRVNAATTLGASKGTYVISDAPAPPSGSVTTFTGTQVDTATEIRDVCRTGAGIEQIVMSADIAGTTTLAGGQDCVIRMNGHHFNTIDFGAAGVTDTDKVWILGPGTISQVLIGGSVVASNEDPNDDIMFIGVYVSPNIDSLAVNAFGTTQTDAQRIGMANSCIWGRAAAVSTRSGTLWNGDELTMAGVTIQAGFDSGETANNDDWSERHSTGCGNNSTSTACTTKIDVYYQSYVKQPFRFGSGGASDIQGIFIGSTPGCRAGGTGTSCQTTFVNTFTGGMFFCLTPSAQGTDSYWWDSRQFSAQEDTTSPGNILWGPCTTAASCDTHELYAGIDFHYTVNLFSEAASGSVPDTGELETREASADADDCAGSPEYWKLDMEEGLGNPNTFTSYADTAAVLAVVPDPPTRHIGPAIRKQVEALISGITWSEVDTDGYDVCTVPEDGELF